MSQGKMVAGAPEISKSEAYQEIYSNQTRLALTPFDTVLVFSRLSEADGTLSIKDEVLVRLSPQACKVLSINLSALMSTWESQFGTIDMAKLSRPPEEMSLAIGKVLSETMERSMRGGDNKDQK